MFEDAPVFPNKKVVETDEACSALLNRLPTTWRLEEIERGDKRIVDRRVAIDHVGEFRDE